MREKRIIVKISENIKFLLMLKNPMIFVKDLLGVTKEKFIVYEMRNGLNYKVRAGTCDRGIIKEIVLHKCYNPAGFEIGENDIVLDIGGQIGIFTAYAAAAAKNGKVYSFEPVPENYELLKENIELNKFKNVEALNMAVAVENGKRSLFYSGSNTGGHSLVQLRPENSQMAEIESISLASFMEREKIAKIDFLKIDCEGGEYEIFYNLSDEYLARIQKISMEYHNLDAERNGEKMKDYLIAKGYKVVITSGKFPMIYAQK